MKVEKIDLTVNGEVKGPIEVILREGAAQQIFYPKKIAAEGLIDSPFRCSSKVKDKDKALVKYSVEDMEIILLADPSDEKGMEIKGKLSVNQDLLAFAINTGKHLNNSQMINHVRTYSHCFANIQDVKNLIQQLQNFELKFEQQLIKTDDRKGTTEDSVKTAIKFVKGELNLEWELNMPIHVGGPKYPIKIQLEIEKQGTAPAFGFYSLELERIMIDAQESIMAKEIEKLKDFTCIQIG